MPPRVLLDATPLGGPHSRRGIGAYVRGLIDGFRQLEAGRRPTLLVRDDHPGPEAFDQVSISMTEWAFRWYPDPRTRRRGEAAIKRINPRLMHATQQSLLPPEVPAVATCHDLIPLRFPDLYLRGRQIGHRREYHRYLERVRRARLVITGSAATAADLTSLLGVPSERIRVIPHGVSSGITPAVPGTANRDGGRYVLFTQSLEPHKNVRLAVQAISHVRTPDVRLKLAGPWSRRRAARLRGLVRGFGVEDRVDLLGYVDDTSLNTLRAEALAVMIPSLVEGFGLPALEAMAAGVPVLGSDAPGLVEVTGPDLPTLPRLDPEPWARAIERLADDEAERGRMAALGLRRAERFRWVETARRTFEVYDEAIRE